MFNNKIFSGYEVETLYQDGLNIRAYIGKELMITNSTRYKMNDFILIISAEQKYFVE